MLVSTNNGLTRTPSQLTIYKSLESDKPFWRILDEDGTDIKVDFGSVVLAVLNRINRVKDLQFQNLDEAAESDVIEWFKHYNTLINAYQKRKELSKPQKLKFYKKYQWLGYDVLQYPYSSEKQFLRKLRKYRCSGLYSSKGCIRLGNVFCEKLIVDGYEALFALDLNELFFNDSLSTKICKCSYCSEYFETTSYKIKYCQECRSNMGKIRYEKYGSEPIHYLKGEITSMMTRTTYNNSKYTYSDFCTELIFYKDMIEKQESNIEKKPEYEDITTKEELVDWLQRKKESLRTYKKRTTSAEKIMKGKSVNGKEKGTEKG